MALGLVAPLAIGFSQRRDSRLIGVTGLAISALSVVTLSAIGFFLERESLVLGLAAFAAFGIGLGLFMAPNSHATIELVPAHYTGTAGAMVNLMRVLGSCIGVSAASSIMSWRLERGGGHDRLDRLFGSRPLLDAIESSLGVMVLFAVIAACACLMRAHQPSQAR